MRKRRNLIGARWRKSSYSGGTGGECVECAPLGGAAWRKSSYSGDTGGDCVEVADLTPCTAVRDSKNPQSAALVFPVRAWSAFLESVKD
ncbi:DUF397 domain-containing protein [Streptomyces sp. NPDC016566]|uniref:DUF397 domain-containing protein n=1 Tax=Streptomyces sp. NPDC016566 TaxID=3364967 RepID=UPI0036FA8E42